MPTTTIRPVLKAGGNITVGDASGGKLYLRYNDGVSEGDCEPSSRCLDYGGGDERQTDLVATCGILKDAKEKVLAVASVSALLPEADIDAIFAERMGFSCEEMREPGNVSDYISFADYVGPVSYHTRTSDIRLVDIMYDGTPVHGDDADHNIKTRYATAWVVPDIENLLDKQHKGDMVDVRIEYVNSEPYGGGFQEVRKCSVQRLDLGCAQPADGGMLCRKVYDKGASETSVRIATLYGDNIVTPIKTYYADENDNGKYSPMVLKFPSVSRACVFLIAFNKDRLVVYRISDTISKFRVTSCRAIRSVALDGGQQQEEGTEQQGQTE